MKNKTVEHVQLHMNHEKLHNETCKNIVEYVKLGSDTCKITNWKREAKDNKSKFKLINRKLN